MTSAAKIKRPAEWRSNPEALASIRRKRESTGHPELRAEVCPDTWLTPMYILNELGEFDLDPCAAKCSPHWACQKSFTVDDDGLTQIWSGRVFMNPPFSNTTKWLYRHSEHRNGISLVPATVESRIWREVVWTKAHSILLLHGRTRFADPHGAQTTGRPLRSIALIAWTEADGLILKNSFLAGVLLTDWRQR